MKIAILIPTIKPGGAEKQAALLAATLSVSMITGCGSKGDNNTDTTKTESKQDSDQEAADKVAKLIDDIYVQERTDKTDEQCTAAKEAWDALTDAQKELVEGENADPDYFGRDTGDASKDDPLNADEIGENEILVGSFGTSFNDSRATDIGGIEKAIQAANPDWSVRRAFTAQIIINHVQARDGEKIDNVDQALQRAVDNGVKNLVVQPTHLMHGAEYDELTAAVEGYKDKFESVKIAEPLLGEVGADATVINADKAAVAEAITAEAVKDAGFDSLDAVKEDGTAFVFMGHGTSHTAKVSYSQMQTQMEQLGYDNVFIGTVEGEPEDTSCEAVIEKLKEGQPFMTTSCCPSYVQLAEKHIPDLKKYISSTGSPMYYTARIVKEKYPDAKIVFVGPCVAKRKEVKLDPCVDFTLTFEEVGSVLEGLGIKIEEAQPFSVLFNAVREAHGFAQSGGVINAVKVYLKDENVNAVQVANLTKKNVALLRAYAKTGKAPAQFIEVMACEGGCVTGPCTHADKTAGQKQLIKELTKF